MCERAAFRICRDDQRHAAFDEASLVSFRVSARRIGVCPRSSVPNCVSVLCVRSRTVRPARVVPVQHRSVRSPRGSVSARRRCGSGAAATAPPNQPARESRSGRRTVGSGESWGGAMRSRDPQSGLGVFGSGTRPLHDGMIAFIDMRREKFGAWAICRTLRASECGFITSRGYRASKNRKASSRSVRGEILIEELQRIHQENYSVYGRLLRRSSRRRCESVCRHRRR